MLKETNLDEVKKIAVSMLYLDIGLTDFSPMIVSHPFTSSGITMIKSDGDFKMVNLIENAADLQLWRDAIKQQISKAESAFSILFLMNKPYYFAFIKFSKPFLSKKDLSKILGVSWTQVEFSNYDANLSKSELVALFKQCDPQYLMDKEDYAAYKNLGSEIVVYRGVTQADMEHVRALSWTLSYEKAEWFAHRWSADGFVYKAKIEKEHTLACFLGRNEKEIIVDPKYLQDIEQMK